MKKFKVILVDDHRLFREGIKSLISTEEIADVIAEAENGKQFLELLEHHEPDLVLMDISMPEMDGVEAARKAIERKPDLHILTLSSFGDEEYYYKMIDAGVKGFVLKNAGIAELERAIREVAEGETYFSNELLRKIITNLGKNSKPKADSLLTKREVEVLQLICNGLTNEEIGEKLHLSTETVKGHRSKLLDKTESRNTAGLVMYAIKNKIIEV